MYIYIYTILLLGPFGIKVLGQLDCLLHKFQGPKSSNKVCARLDTEELGPQKYMYYTSTWTPFATKVLGQLDGLLHKFQGPKSSTEVCAKLGQAVSIPVLALLDKGMDSAAVQVGFNSQP